MKSLQLVILMLALAGVCQAQTGTADIYVNSWKTNPGNTIREQRHEFDLDSNREHTTTINDVGAGSYKLILTCFPAGKEAYQPEYWVVQLKQVLSKGRRKEKLGDNLLTSEGPGIGDYFPREDLVGILYPRESPTNILEKIGQPNGGYYAISSRRVIHVQNFYVIIKATSFKLSEPDHKALDSMHVTVEFTNSYRKGNDAN